ncbi:MAG: DNA-deoxyinosine glycosylase [Treponema sp.]|nr:DNA-deoxyinosine glycosylase [Treponema sp.]
MITTDTSSCSSSNLQFHPFPPVFDSRSRILILGSFPSVRSREEGFFYGHPRNRFWQVLHLVFASWDVSPSPNVTSQDENSSPDTQPQAFFQAFPQTIQQRKEFLLNHGIALWDVAASCTVTGSSDSSITQVVPNDISLILSTASIKNIYTNGQKAHQLYCKHLQPLTGRPAICLPSTSPANASYSLERLVSQWRHIAHCSS